LISPQPTGAPETLQAQPGANGRARADILLEAIAVALIGAGIAFLANVISPRGLKLSYNYFPLARGSLSASAVTNSSVETLAAKLQAAGLHLADSNLVVQFFHDPHFQQGLVIFIDARSEQAYRDGHIPGAYLFDHFHPDQYLPLIWQPCLNAQQIVVYCNGGDCEDSQFTAINLGEAGIPKDKLFVYGGGITEWESNSLPVELGERNSGQLKK